MNPASAFLAIATFLFLVAFAMVVKIIDNGNPEAIALLGAAAFSVSFLLPGSRRWRQ